MHLNQLREKSPELVSQSIQQQVAAFHNMDMREGCWDKRLYNMYGICHILEEENAL